MRIIIFLSVYAMALACAGDGLVGNSKKSVSRDISASISIDSGTQSYGAEKDSKKSARPADSGKPTDDSEGIPGYLVDPSLIELLTESDGSLTIMAHQGAIASGGQEMKVSLYTAGREDFETNPNRPFAVDHLEDITLTDLNTFTVTLPRELVDVYLIIDTRGKGQLNDIPGDLPKETAAFASAMLHQRFYDLIERNDSDAYGGFSLYCAIGKIGGNKNPEVIMTNFPGHEKFRCGQCDETKVLWEGHPLAKIMEDAHPCRLESAAGPVVEAVGFFRTIGGNCSKVGTRCSILKDQPFLGTRAMIQGQFEAADSFRTAFAATAQRCNAYYGGSLIELLTSGDATGIQCDRFNEVKLSPQFVGCQIPPTGISLSEATICSRQSLARRFQRHTNAGTCHFFLEPPVHACR